MLYVATSQGYTVRVDTESARAAIAAVETQYGRALNVYTPAEYERRNRPDPATCAHCGEPKTLCGNWCRVGGMP